MCGSPIYTTFLGVDDFYLDRLYSKKFKHKKGATMSSGKGLQSSCLAYIYTYPLIWPEITVVNDSKGHFTIISYIPLKAPVL